MTDAALNLANIVININKIYTLLLTSTQPQAKRTLPKRLMSSRGLQTFQRPCLCRRETCRLHADIVMSLEDIFAYISSKTGQICTKLGTGMGNGKRVILENLLGRSLHEPQGKGQMATFLFRS